MSVPSSSIPSQPVYSLEDGRFFASELLVMFLHSLLFRSIRGDPTGGFFWRHCFAVLLICLSEWHTKDVSYGNGTRRLKWWLSGTYIRSAASGGGR